MAVPFMYGAGTSGNQQDFFTQGGSGGYLGLTAGLSDLERQAYLDSSLKSTFENPELGQVPQSTMNSYFDLASKQALDRGGQAINRQFSDLGYAPTRVGAQAELGGRLGANIALAQAEGMMKNAAQGANVRAQTQQQTGTNRYNVLTRPMETYYNSQLGLGAGSNLASAAGGTYARQNPGPSMGSAAGLSSGAGQTPWWQTSYAGMGSSDSPQSTQWNAAQPKIPDDTLSSYLQSISQGRDAYGGS